MPSENISSDNVVSRFEQAKDLPSFQSAFQSAALLSHSDQAEWQQAQSKLATTDLTALGLGGFSISGIQDSPTNASGNQLPPEIDLVAKDGSGTVEHVDAQGNIYDQSNSLTGSKLSFNADATAASAPTTDSTSNTTSPPTDLTTPLAPTTDSTTSTTATPTDATTTPAPATDSTTAPPTTDATTLAPATSFGPNGRMMQLTPDGTSGTYSIQSGDNLWSIAQDALTPPGETLTTDQKAAMAPETLALVDRIAQDNNIADPNEIQPGQQIVINGLTPPDSSTSQTTQTNGDLSTTSSSTTVSSDTSTTSDSTTPPAASPALSDSFLAAIQQIDGAYNPLLPAGVAQSDFANGQWTPDGQGNFIANTNASTYGGAEDLAPDGTLVSSKFTYAGGVTMPFADGNGGQVSVNGVDSITNQQNPDGSYSSTITDEAGEVFNSTINAAGSVQSFTQSQPQDASQAPQAPDLTLEPGD